MNTMDFAAKPIRNARETYWMYELRTFFPYVINDRIGDGLKTDNKNINVAAKFSSWLRKHSCVNRSKNHKDVPLLSPPKCLNDLNNILNINIKVATNFIRILISSKKKSYLEITHELLTTNSYDSPPDHVFDISPTIHRSY